MGRKTDDYTSLLNREGIVTLPDGRPCVVFPVNNIVEAAAVVDAAAQVVGWQLPPGWEAACKPLRDLLLAGQLPRAA